MKPYTVRVAGNYASALAPTLRSIILKHLMRIRSIVRGPVVVIVSDVKDDLSALAVRSMLGTNNSLTWRNEPVEFEADLTLQLQVDSQSVRSPELKDDMSAQFDASIDAAKSKEVFKAQFIMPKTYSPETISREMPAVRTGNYSDFDRGEDKFTVSSTPTHDRGKIPQQKTGGEGVTWLTGGRTENEFNL